MKQELYIKGMTCTHCEMRVKETLLKIEGVKSVKASFKDGKAYVTGDFDTDKASAALEEIGYKLILKKQNKKTPLKEVLPIFLIMSVLFIIFGNVFNFIPSISNDVSLPMLFLIGILTSVHCIGMCGSINLAVVMKKDSSLKNPLLYNLGRVISYTLIGGIVGGLGSIFTVNTDLQSLIIFLAGTVMFFMGLSMLGWLPDKLYFLIPKMPKVFKGAFNSKKGPLYVGLLNGLMPCGPLQAMQIYALSTASIVNGALAMFIFSLGTVPLMFGFGVLFVKLKGKHQFLIQRISSVLIMLLAFLMINRALNLQGIDISKTFRRSMYNDYSIAEIKDGIQYVEIQLSYKGYEPIMVQKDIPVVFNIKVSDIRYFGCTNSIRIPSLNISQDLKTGDNLIEFTPTKAGNITYTCWMGMVTSNIRVVEDLSEYE
jgi:uncharacterized protein